MADRRKSNVWSGASEHSNENGNIRDNVLIVVARHNCGATGCGIRRIRLFGALHVRILCNGLPRRATICEATKVLAEEQPHN